MMFSNQITSKSNDKVKCARKLLRSKKERDSLSLFAAEGEKTCLELLKFYKPVMIFLLESEMTIIDEEHDSVVYIVNEDILRHISGLMTPQKIICVFEKSNLESKEVLERPQCKAVYLDSVQDSGNLGTMIRTAYSFGVDAVLLGESNIDIYNPKVIRACSGYIGKIPCFSVKPGENDDIIRNFTVIGTVVDPCNAQDIRFFKANSDKTLLVFGNEGSGISDDMNRKCDYHLYIPMKEGAESLNVAVAFGIITYYLFNSK